jgi:hypothetical protein
MKRPPPGKLIGLAVTDHHPDLFHDYLRGLRQLTRQGDPSVLI